MKANEDVLHMGTVTFKGYVTYCNDQEMLLKQERKLSEERKKKFKELLESRGLNAEYLMSKDRLSKEEISSILIALYGEENGQEILDEMSRNLKWA